MHTNPRRKSHVRQEPRPRGIVWEFVYFCKTQCNRRAKRLIKRLANRHDRRATRAALRHEAIT